MMVVEGVELSVLLSIGAMFIPVLACILALYCENIVRTRCIATYLIHYLTISMGILSVVVLALAKVIDGSVCAALLGGIFGYVLGKQVSRSAIARDDLQPVVFQEVQSKSINNKIE
jgi:positive regulator of sigma E activity